MQAFRPFHHLIRRHFSLSRVSYENRFPTDLHEPDYLASLVPDYPIYDSLTIQLKSYDYPLLENFHSFVNKLANIMDLDVEDGWGIPPEKFIVQRFKPLSSTLDTEYKLNIYERNIQIVDVPATKYPIFLRMVQESSPEGVMIKADVTSDEDQKLRFIPDNQLLTLKQQLEELGGPRDKKKKK